eukprot:symbB.v1.2.030132.t1/scaffold3364.1/size60096/1
MQGELQVPGLGTVLIYRTVCTGLFFLLFTITVLWTCPSNKCCGISARRLEQMVAAFVPWVTIAPQQKPRVVVKQTLEDKACTWSYIVFAGR